MSEAGAHGSFHDLDPEVYARWRASRLGAVTERLETNLILEFVGDARRHMVLDVGCGDGALAVTLDKRGASVVGIDRSAAMIAAAKHRASEKRADVDFLVADARRLPFRDAQFDIVIAVAVLCFVADAAASVREMARVLRPGGRLVIGELGKWSCWAASRRLRGWLGASLWRGVSFRTSGDLRTLANQAGLRPGPVRGAVYYPRSAAAARLLAPWEPCLGRITTIGAAFVALQAAKPPP